MLSPQSKDKIQANKKNVMDNATRDGKHLMLNEQSRFQFSTAKMSGTESQTMPPPETAPHQLSKRRIHDDDEGLDIQSKEEVIVNVATDREQVNIVSDGDKSSIFKVDGPNSD